MLGKCCLPVVICTLRVNGHILGSSVLPSSLILTCSTGREELKLRTHHDVDSQNWNKLGAYLTLTIPNFYFSLWHSRIFYSYINRVLHFTRTAKCGDDLNEIKLCFWETLTKISKIFWQPMLPVACKVPRDKTWPIQSLLRVKLKEIPCVGTASIIST